MRLLRRAACLACLLLVACSDDDGAQRDAGPRRDAGAFDAGPRQQGCVAALPVDILWVIDNSNSMQEEQANLAANFGDLVEVLTTPTDDDRDGMPDYPPVDDLRMAVVSTDLGVADTAGVIGCPAGPGDDGVMISTPRTADPACDGRGFGPPPFLDWRPGQSTAELSQTFSCIARLGTTGCGIEQQLEAPVRALTVKAEGGGPNEGFLRPNSLVAVVIVTDEEDCSTDNAEIFDPSPAARTRLGSFGLRCAFHPELLYPTSRFVNILDTLRLDRAGDVVVAAITGVPIDLVDDPAEINYETLLADPRMAYQPDPEDGNQLAPACQLGGAGKAVPARRIVEVVREFADTGDGIVQSICATDYRPAIRAIAKLITRRVCEAPI